MVDMSLNELLVNAAFYMFALIALVSAYLVAKSTNIVRTAFSLLGVLFSFGGLYGLIRADFLFAVQILVYVGGILVLIIFAVMLTHKISNVNLSNESSASSAGIMIIPMLFLVLLVPIMTITEYVQVEPQNRPLTGLIGTALFNEYLIPFEVISVLLLASLIGAVYLARKEVKE